VAPGADPNRVAAVLNGWGDVSVFTTQGQRELLLNGSVEKTRQQIGLFQTLLTLIAATIMALILYTLTLDKIRSIAILKLIGAPNTVILGLILRQALLLGGVGYGIAYVVGQQVFHRFPRRVIVTTDDLIQLAVVVAVISVASSLLGIWKAFRVSPNEALS
jgi:putative ABC transport system permease protein